MLPHQRGCPSGAVPPRAPSSSPKTRSSEQNHDVTALRRTTLALLLGLTPLFGGACSSGTQAPGGIADPAATATPLTVPTWFPSGFVAPAGSVVIEAIDTAADGVGPSVTWKVPGNFDQVVTQVRNTLNGLGWRPADTTESNEGGSRRTSFFVENSQVYAARIFQDPSLSGVRLTVELPQR